MSTDKSLEPRHPYQQYKKTDYCGATLAKFARCGRRENHNVHTVAAPAPLPEKTRHKFERSYGVPNGNDVCRVRLAESNYQRCGLSSSADVHQPAPLPEPRCVKLEKDAEINRLNPAPVATPPQKPKFLVHYRNCEGTPCVMDVQARDEKEARLLTLSMVDETITIDHVEPVESAPAGEPNAAGEVMAETRCEFTCHDPLYASMCKVPHRCELNVGHGWVHKPEDFKGHDKAFFTKSSIKSSRVAEAREWMARGKRVFRPDIVEDLCKEIDVLRRIPDAAQPPPTLYAECEAAWLPYRDGPRFSHNRRGVFEAGYIAGRADQSKLFCERDTVKGDAERYKSERDSLGTAIAEAAQKAGVYNGEVPLTGPELIRLCDDLAEKAPAPQPDPVAEIGCVCGESFQWPASVADGEHVHCPSCGSQYDSRQNFLISKRQVKTLQSRFSEWSKCPAK